MTNLLADIRLGASRPVRVLPGEAGIIFVRRLYDAAGAQLTEAAQEHFRLVRSVCQCANDAATRGRHDESLAWITLANRMLEGLSGDALLASLSCIKSNESFVHYARRDFPAAARSLDEATDAERAAEPSPADANRNVGDTARTHLWFLRHFHYLHLHGRIQLAAGNLEAAIAHLLNALRDSGIAAQAGADLIELLGFSCSRIVGELAIAGAFATTAEGYLAATADAEKIQTEGSVAEYIIFRNAWSALRLRGDAGEMRAFVRDGRMKTVCWYVAVVELAPLLAPAERTALVVLSTQWRDMPSLLRSKLLATITH